MLFEDCGFLGEWPGVPKGDEEGELISEARILLDAMAVGALSPIEQRRRAASCGAGRAASASAAERRRQLARARRGAGVDTDQSDRRLTEALSGTPAGLLQEQVLDHATRVVGR